MATAIEIPPARWRPWKGLNMHYLTDPLVVVLVELEQVEELLWLLANADQTPLPRRLQQPLRDMHRRLGAILREVRQRPSALSTEAAAERRWDPMAP